MGHQYEVSFDRPVNTPHIPHEEHALSVMGSGGSCTFGNSAEPDFWSHRATRFRSKSDIAGEVLDTATDLVKLSVQDASMRDTRDLTCKTMRSRMLGHQDFMHSAGDGKSRGLGKC